MELNKFIKAACISTCLGLSSGSILANSNFNFETNGGLKVYDENNNDHWFRLSGKVKFDQTYYLGDAVSNSNNLLDNSANLRSVDANLSGGLGRDTSYNMNLSTGKDGSLNLSKASINYSGFNGWSKVSVGEVSSPYGAENASSTSFLEKSLVTSAFNPDSGLGVAVNAWTDQVGVRLSVTQPKQTDQDKSGFDQLSSSLRLSFAPVNTDNLVFHLGFSGQLMTAAKDKTLNATFKTHLESRGKRGKAVLNAEENGLKQIRAFAMDAAMQRGPLFLQAELHRADLNKNDNNLALRGYNAQATYALTGESRHYNYQTGGFSGLTPSNDSGAWEVSVRNSYLDMASVNGENARNLGASVAWTANSNLKVLANYIHTTSTKEEANNVGAFAVRLQASW
jgi:phosphate-selective porin OprO/OprP